MLAAERRDMIRRYIKRNGSVKVAELQERLQVSPVTIRRDLDELSAEGIIVRTHGGAISTTIGNLEPPYDVKKDLNKEQKRQIGIAAADMVSNGETIIVDSGSTTYEMIDGLKIKVELTIVTNDLVIATKLASNNNNSPESVKYGPRTRLRAV